MLSDVKHQYQYQYLYVSPENTFAPRQQMEKQHLVEWNIVCRKKFGLHIEISIICSIIVAVAAVWSIQKYGGTAPIWNGHTT